MSTYNTFTTLIVSVQFPNISADTYESAEASVREQLSNFSERVTSFCSETLPDMKVTIDHVDDIEVMQNPEPVSVSNSYTSMSSLLSTSQPESVSESSAYTRLTN